MFGLYKSQIDADFSLYKGQRDNYDALKTQIEELKTQVAVVSKFCQLNSNHKLVFGI